MYPDKYAPARQYWHCPQYGHPRQYGTPHIEFPWSYPFIVPFLFNTSSLLSSFDSSTNTTTYIIYIYDESGVVGFKTGTSLDNLTTYYFVKNLQNDVIQIIDINSNVVVEYTYDAYGNVFISGTLSNTIGKLNPYRYRGYYYDEETNLFLVSSRYYSPELCRWISPDSIEYLDSESVNGLNLYCYCLNDPVMCR